MIALIQRVSSASVHVGEQLCGQIGPGVLALVAVTGADGPAQAERLEQRVLVFYCNTLIRELNLTVEQEGKDGGPAALENALRFPLSLPAAAAVDQA